MEERLKKFASLVDSGTFTAGARDLHVSQPALSAAIAKLEKELGARLLVRGVRQLTLTPAGRLAYDTAKSIAASTDNLDVRLRELAHIELELKIGMIDSVAATVFAHPETFTALEERARISVVVDNSRALLQTVERGALDIALVVADRQPHGLLRLQPLADEPLVLVTQAAHASELAKQLANGRLPGFISYDRASTTCRLITDALGLQNVVPESVFFSTSPEVMLRLVCLGRGVAVLPYLLVRSRVARGELTVMSDVFIPRPIALAQRRDKILPAQLRQLTLALRRELQALQQEASAAA